MHLCSSDCRALWIFIHSLRHQMHSGYAARLSLILFIMGSQCLCFVFWEHVIVPSALAYKITPPSLCHYSIMWNVKKKKKKRPFSVILTCYSTPLLPFFYLPNVMNLKLKNRQHSRDPPRYSLKLLKLQSYARLLFSFYASSWSERSQI